MLENKNQAERLRNLFRSNNLLIPGAAIGVSALILAYSFGQRTLADVSTIKSIQAVPNSTKNGIEYGQRETDSILYTLNFAQSHAQLDESSVKYVNMIASLPSHALQDYSSLSLDGKKDNNELRSTIHLYQNPDDKKKHRPFFDMIIDKNSTGDIVRERLECQIAETDPVILALPEYIEVRPGIAISQKTGEIVTIDQDELPDPISLHTGEALIRIARKTFRGIPEDAKGKVRPNLVDQNMADSVSFILTNSDGSNTEFSLFEKGKVKIERVNPKLITPPKGAPQPAVNM